MAAVHVATASTKEHKMSTSAAAQKIVVSGSGGDLEPYTFAVGRGVHGRASHGGKLRGAVECEITTATGGVRRTGDQGGICVVDREIIPNSARS